MKRDKTKQRTQAGITLDLDEFDILEPNPFELDRESIIQPRLVFAYLKEKAETQARIRGLKSELKVAISELKKTDARLDYRIRRRPAKYKLEKVTESSVANTIILQESHAEAERDVWKVEKLESVRRYASDQEFGCAEPQAGAGRQLGSSAAPNCGLRLGV